MSPQPKRAAARKGGGSSAARNGKGQLPETFSFRGLAIKTPKKVPDTLYYDLGEMAMLGQAGDAFGVLGLQQRILSELLGPDELVKMRSKVKGAEDNWRSELLNKVLEIHGLDPGEA